MRLSLSRVVLTELNRSSFHRNVISLCGSFFDDVIEKNKAQDECLCILRGVQSMQERRVDTAISWFFAASGDAAVSVLSRNKAVHRSLGQALTVPQEFQDAVEKQELSSGPDLPRIGSEPRHRRDGMVDLVIEHIRVLQMAAKMADGRQSDPERERE